MSVSQGLFPPSVARRDIPVMRISVRGAGEAAITPFSVHPHVGVSTQVSSDGFITRLALATVDRIVVLSIEPKRGKLSALANLLQDGRGTGPTLVGFGMAHMALQIRRDIKLDVVQSVDLSTLCSPSTTEVWPPSKLAARLSALADASEINRLWYGMEEDKSDREVALRAWVSVLVAGCRTTEIENSLKVNTQNLTGKELKVLGDLVHQSDILTAHKPKETPNDFVRGDLTKEGMKLENARYQNRVRRSDQTSVILTDSRGREFTGRAQGANGRLTDISFNKKQFSGNLTAVRVVGREEATCAEKARDEFVLRALLGEVRLAESCFVGFLWFPETQQLMATGTSDTEGCAPPNLNASQRHALSRMTSTTPLVIIQGPPGTGKTKTIAAAAAVWEAQMRPVWIVAQSNVAVKNIAEKLFKEGINFKVLVSKEFYFEWHEHIYSVVADNLIRTDEFAKDHRGMGFMLGGARVILCTLSALSNPVLDQVGMFLHVPVERLIVDEASQINIFEFMHIFHKFKKTLGKVCFFGDPMQLPPYGTDQAPSLKSVFELPHLQNLTEFLDTQYRMPVPIGHFISTHVYDDKLRSEHSIKSMDCVAFINASKGHESQSGLSWKNSEEIHTLCHLVRHYYSHKHFCIITPYDAQRAAIERQLKTEDLPHHMVFNVDSFQGNEADYVLISVVRTTQPGFLKSLNRMNVMLTRARAGMIIVTNRDFLRSDGGRRTLLGQLALHWESENWRNIWIDWRAVADTSAHLPGSLGPLPPSGPGSNEAVRTVTELGDAAQFPPLPMRIIPSAENESAVWGKRLFPARPLDTACISQSDVRVVQYIPRSPVPPTRMTQPAVGGSWAKRTKVEQTYADLPRRFSSLYEFPPLE